MKDCQHQFTHQQAVKVYKLVDDSPIYQLVS